MKQHAHPDIPTRLCSFEARQRLRYYGLDQVAKRQRAGAPGF